MESPALESSSSNLLLYVLIGLGIVLVLAVVALAIWMSKRSSSSAQPQAFGGPYGATAGQPMPNPPMGAGRYPDPQGQARLRWYDGNQWTANTQN